MAGVRIREIVLEKRSVVQPVKIVSSLTTDNNI